MDSSTGLYQGFLDRERGRVLDSSTLLDQGFLAKPAPTIYYVFVAMTYLLRSGLCQDGDNCKISTIALHKIYNYGTHPR